MPMSLDEILAYLDKVGKLTEQLEEFGKSVDKVCDTLELAQAQRDPSTPIH